MKLISLIACAYTNMYISPQTIIYNHSIQYTKYTVQYQCSEACLASGGHEDQGGFLRRVLPDGGVGGLVHRGHAGAVVLAREALLHYII